MQEKTVLVIAYYFPPLGLSGVQRTLKFVKYLREYGWNVVVLTDSPGAYYAYDESQDQEYDSDSVHVFRTPPKGKQKNQKANNFPSYFTQKIGRAALQTVFQPDRQIRWKNDAVKLGREIMEQYNINCIFATAPPFTDFLVANELSKEFNKPFVVDYRDTWVDNPFHFYATPFHKNYSIKLESEILTRASKVIVTTRHSKEIILKRYRFLSHNDVTIVSHGYDPSDFEPHKVVAPDKHKFVITHSGLFQDNRTPKYFFNALSNFFKNNPGASEHTEARFIGLMRKSHHKFIRKYKLEKNVNLTGYLKHSETVKNLMESDVLWLMMKDTIRSPGKLYEYFGAEKPMIICSPDGVMRKIALESEAAIATEPKDVKAIEAAIKEYYDLWKKHQLPKPKEDFVRMYDRFKLTGDLARELALVADM